MYEQALDFFEFIIFLLFKLLLFLFIYLFNYCDQHPLFRWDFHTPPPVICNLQNCALTMRFLIDSFIKIRLAKAKVKFRAITEDVNRSNDCIIATINRCTPYTILNIMHGECSCAQWCCKRNDHYYFLVHLYISDSEGKQCY